jgi:predicted  nucleic acid-binding Zn-ribbon protein
MGRIEKIADAFPVTMIVAALLGYLSLDISTHLTRAAAKETSRRVFSLSMIFLVSTYLLSILYSEVSSAVPSLSGPVMTAVWIVSLFFVLLGEWRIYHLALAHSKLVEAAKLSVPDLGFERVKTILEPHTQMIAEMKVSVSELLSRSRDLLTIVETQTTLVKVQTQTITSIEARVQQREKVLMGMAREYKKWYNERKDSNEVIAMLVRGAEDLLERFGVLSAQIDQYLDYFAHEGRESEAGQAETPKVVAGFTGEQHEIQVEQSSPREAGAKTLPTGGKLTREVGIANREKGNRAQLQFSETVLRERDKRHDCSLREGDPDFLFHDSATNRPKSVGAFKALTLSESGTKQRWIPRRKLIAEILTGTRLGIPLVLFVQNLANGRVWAKVLSLEEQKEFEGITTPLLLIESDPDSEKICRETLDTALKLL